MTSLIIASNDKEKVSQWVNALKSLYSVKFCANLSALFSQNKPNHLLIVDCSLIVDERQLSLLTHSFNKVFVIGKSFTPDQQVQLIYEGVCGYSDLSINKPLILRAIAGVLNNEIWIQRQLVPTVIKKVVKDQKHTRTGKRFSDVTLKKLSILTQRETEVIELTYNGANNTQIAETLDITIRTVKAHLTAIFRKLDVNDRFQLIVLLKDLHVKHLLDSKPTRNLTEN